MKEESIVVFIVIISLIAITSIGLPVRAFSATYYDDYTFSTLASKAGQSGIDDGAGGDAKFSCPYGMAVDISGFVYVADSANCTIRKITPGGTVSTLAGQPDVPGSDDGTGSAARFSRPYGVAVDSSNNVYVADTFNHTIRKITPGGTVSTLAGQPGVPGSDDGTGSAARFNRPYGVALDGNANVYVADAYNNTIREITSGNVVSTLAGCPPSVCGASSPGTDDGAGSTARFSEPFGVAVDNSGNIYVADTLNQTIRKITPAFQVTTLAGSPGQGGGRDGTGTAARFSYPSGIGVDSAGIVYVADYGNSTIRKGWPKLDISWIGRVGDDIQFKWKTVGGITNWVEISPCIENPGACVSLSVPIIPDISTNNYVGFVNTNYVDLGGATNGPARFYRIKWVLSDGARAVDSAADLVYTNTWAGDSGGYGFGPWVLTKTSPSASSNGFLVGSSTKNASGALPGIDTVMIDDQPSTDTVSRAWGIYANGGNFAAAYRSFTNGALQVGQSVLISMDNGYIDTSNSVGFVLRNGNVTDTATNYNTGARFEFLYIGGDASNSYKVVDSAGLHNIGMPWTGTGLRVKVTLTQTNSYALEVVDNAGGTTNTQTGTLGGTNTVDSIAIYNRNAGPNGDHEVFFNSLAIINP